VSWMKAIEELLQEIAQQQNAPQQRPPGPPRPAARRPVQPVVEAEVIPDGPEAEDVATHVSQHITTAEIAQHTAGLGTEVRQTDSKVQAHLQSKFDHRVASIDARSGVAARGGVSARPTDKGPRRPAAASELVQMLRDPKSIRQAFVLSEIFQRPEERW